MAGNNIDAVFDAIIQDCQTIASKAVEGAARKVQKDFIDEADKYLHKYYDNYSPRIYKRTFALKNLIKPVLVQKGDKNNIVFEVGVEYNSARIRWMHHSNSWYHQSGEEWIPVGSRGSSAGQNNGIPEPAWITENFLEGIHPWAQTDAESTQSLMQDFIDNQLPSRINSYVQNSFWDNIVSKL